MTRVATIPIQRTMSDAIQRTQQKLAAGQLQLATQKKAHDYAALGTATARNMSAHALLQRSEAHADVAKRIDTTLTLYDAHMGGIEEAVSKMRQEILTAIGTGKSAGLQDAINGAFDTFRSALNAEEAGVPLFAGSKTDAAPFKPQSLADTLNFTNTDAFNNDTIRVAARVSDNVDVEIGIGANEAGSGLFDAFRKLAEAGSIGDEPNAAQLTALKDAMGLLDTGLEQLRGVNAANGRKQADIEATQARIGGRMVLLKDVIGQNEDADMGQVAIEIAQHQATLQASYSVFAQLSKLSLANFL